MKKHFLITLLFFQALFVFAQNSDKGQIHGSLQFDAQTYQEDSTIGAYEIDEKMAANIYANFIYTKGNFSAGTRFEGYMPTLEGFEPRNEGLGFPYAWAKYNIDKLEVTVGSFYDQFGSGLIFRTYEEKNLGYDNAMSGLHLKYQIGNGITLKGIYGHQREKQIVINKQAVLQTGRGIVRGLDAEFYLNELIPGMAESQTQISFGASFISRYEEDDNSKYKLPLNVGAGAARFNLYRGGFNVSGEYAYKTIDPSASGRDNSNGNVGHEYIYKNGQGVFLTASYSTKGLGVALMAKSIDNMNFRSERTALLNNLLINYIPDITKNHTYAFAAMYPYGTQPNGEAGYQAEVTYKIPKKSMLGGKYGTGLTLSYSRMFNLKKEPLNELVPMDNNYGTEGYTTSLTDFGDELFFQDMNLEISKKFNKKLKGIFTAQYLNYDNAILHGASDNNPLDPNIVEEAEEEHFIEAMTFIADVTYKFASRKAIRLEMQHLSTEQNFGNWGMALLEYSIPNWFFILSDQYNYGNQYEDKQVHYYTAAVVFVHKANRFQLGYGKQREGVVCTGGVCRKVPAAYGFTVSVTSSF